MIEVTDILQRVRNAAQDAVIERGLRGPDAIYAVSEQLSQIDRFEIVNFYISTKVQAFSDLQDSVERMLADDS